MNSLSYRASLSILPLIFIFFITLFFSILALSFNDSYILRCVTLLSFFLFLFFLLKESLLFFYLFLLYIYGYVGQIISVFFIENKVYLNELSMYSQPNGAMSVLVMLIAVFLFINYFIFLFFFKNKSDFLGAAFSINKNGKIIILFNVLFFLIYALIIILYGNAYDSAEGNRVIYRHSYLPTWAGILIDIQWIPVFISGLLFVINRTKIFFFFLFLHLFFRLLFGEKFTMLAQLSYIAFLPYVVFFNNRINVYKFIYICTFLLLIFISIIIIYYFNIEEAGLERFSQRLAQQGQVWWYSFHDYFISNSNSIYSFINEFSSSSKGECLQGMDLIMCKIMTPSLYYLFLDNKYVLTSGYPAILLFYFREFGVIAFVFLSFIAILPLYLIFVSLRKGKIIASVFAFRLFFSFFSFYIVGNLSDLLNYKIIIYFIAWMAVYFMPNLILNLKREQI